MSGEPQVWCTDPVTGRWMRDPLQDGGGVWEDIARGIATAMLVGLVLANIAVWTFV